jgi:hypothetical protein
VALYEQVEDSVLADLVTASVVAQSDVIPTSPSARAASLAGLDQSAWTADQYKAFYEANAKTGDERTAAMQALADAGQLTQAQADALSRAGSERPVDQDLAECRHQLDDSDRPLHDAAGSLHAEQLAARRGHLPDGKGGMLGGFGLGGGNFGGRQDSSKNSNSNRMMGDGAAATDTSACKKRRPTRRRAA